MKKLTLVLVCVSFLFMELAAWAIPPHGPRHPRPPRGPHYHAPLVKTDSMIEVGAGTAVLDGETIEALIKVDFNGRWSGSTWIVARTKAAASVGLDGVGYVDFHFETVGIEYGRRGAYWGMTFGNFDLQRNVVIDQDYSFRVTLVGIHGGVSERIDKNVRLLVKGAVDLLGIGLTRRFSDGAESAGVGTGGFLEAGVEIDKKVRVMFGEKFGVTSAKPVSSYSGRVCDTYYDDWSGTYYTECYDDTSTTYLDNRFYSDTYLSLVVNLTQNLRAFAEAHYNMYVVSDYSYNGDENSVDGAFQVLLGIGGRF